jgi:hypothetical protein
MLLARGRFNILATVSSIIGVMSLATTSASALGATPNDGGGGGSSDERRMMAQSLLEQGLKSAESDPKGALGALRSSYEVDADYHVLYHVGRVCVRVKDASCALSAYERYLKDGGSDIPTKRRKDVEKEIKTLSRAVGTLTIKSSIKNVDVKIDGVVVGKTPLAQAVTVNPGAHRVVLGLDGGVEKSVQIAAGNSESVDLDAPAPKEEAAVIAAAAPPPAPMPEPAPLPPPAPRRAGVPVLPWIATAALAGGTIATGFLTMRANDAYNSARDTYPITREELDARHEKAQMLLFITGGLGVATLVSLAVAGYSTLSRGSAPPPNRDRMIGIAVGPTGISVSGRIP